MNRVRAEWLQWFGFGAAPVAWAIHLVAGFFLVEARCGSTRLGSGWEPSQTALTAVAALVAVLGEVAAATVYAGLRGVDRDAAGPPGRQRLFAIGGLVGNPLFLLAILLTGLTVLSGQGCRQS